MGWTPTHRPTRGEAIHTGSATADAPDTYPGAVSPRPRAPRSPAPASLLLALLVLLALLGPFATVTAPTSSATPTHAATSAPAAAARDPRTTRPFFVDATMPAARAGAAYAAIGRRPQARWFTDGAYPSPAAVRAGVAEYAARATRARRTPMVVLYAIPGRDCGGASSGGLPSASAYTAWVRAAARGLRGTRPMVVLEPDAIPFATRPECGDAAARLRLLAAATRTLTRAGGWVYLDAGHSDWVDAATTARLLRGAGVARARGFAVNVANHQPNGPVQAWAGQVRTELARLGVPGRRFVVDTSRNGTATPVSGDWCNPTWARLGTHPARVFRGGLDARLWIKNPGESDGECHGGPAAGTWWPEGADVLLGR